MITALKAMTIRPAWHPFEADRKSPPEVGKLADLTILPADPTAVDPKTLDRIDMLATVEEGETVFDAASGGGRLSPAADEILGRALRAASLASPHAGDWARLPLETELR